MNDSQTPSTRTHHDSFATPREDGCGEESSENLYDFLPKAPRRFRESRSENGDCDNCGCQISYPTKPLSDRLFLDLDANSDVFDRSCNTTTDKNETNETHFVPFTLAPSNKSFYKSERRKPRTLFKNSKNKNKNKQLAVCSASKSQHSPRLSVSWIEKRTNQLLLRDCKSLFRDCKLR